MVFNANIKPNWLSSQNAMWYRTTDSDQSVRYQLIKFKSQENQLIFDSHSVVRGINKLIQERDKSLAEKKAKALNLSFDKKLENVFFLIDKKTIQYNLKTKRFKTIASDKVPSLQLKQAPIVRPSSSGTPSAQLRVENKSGEDFEIFWIDTSGAPRSYGIVKNGGQYRQSTYIGHRWLARSKNGKNLAFFSVDNEKDFVQVKKGDSVSLKVARRLGRHQDFYLRGNKDYKRKPRTRKTNKAYVTRSGRRSSDGKWKVEIRENNVVLINIKTKKESKLSRDGDSKNFYNGTVYWAPNSKHFVAIQEKPAQRHTVSFVESSPRNQLQPKLHSNNYLKPGDKVRILRPQMFSITKKKKISVSNQLFDNPYVMSRFGWRFDSKEFSFLYNQRGHQILRYIGINTDGRVREIVGDKFETFIHYSAKTYLKFLESTGEFLWASERDGWNHLYLIDGRSGKVTKQITKGNWVVREVNRIDVEKRQIWFTASGIRKEQDPYYIHYCRINFDGTGLVVLTEGNGTHRIQYSPDEKYFIDRFSRVDMPTVTELRKSEDGSLVCTLEKGNWKPLLKAGWKAPERFSAKGRDGKTDIYGVIYRPSNFDSKKTYPVIEYIYAGPHNSFVPKSFGPYLFEKALTELGFIVVQIDGMGTNNRGKKFHDVCWKNLGDSGFPDRIKWIHAAAKKYPEMDVSKVGIFGGSAGGQSSTRALLAFGDFYKVAVSDCGCHDNRMDKIWWNEQWMGWPIGDHYKEQSNVTQAHHLTGDLFLIVGEVDRNVDPASTMQVVDALIKADKDFDLLVVPGGGHGVGWTRYGKRRTADYFVRKILGVRPREN